MDLDPDRDTEPDRPVRKSTPDQLGEAFCELLTRIPSHWMPKVGGMSPRIVVKLDYQQLLTGLGTATLDTGDRISAAHARQLACESGIIPAVFAHSLGGDPVLLDLGTERRFHTGHQRLADLLTRTDNTCAATGCDRTALHAHHPHHWAHGGATTTTNHLAVCPYHHGLAHSPDYDTDIHPDRTITFHRRT